METENKEKCLKECLYERIECEDVCPRSRLFFHSRECLVWFLWFISILVGSIAVAISLFVVTHRQYDFYEATHNNFLTFLVDFLPYLWLFIFALMVLVAVYNLRHTAKGYRRPLWFILASSLVLSFAGGSALQFFGLGYKIDNVLGEQMSMYQSQKKIEQKMWQAPKEGRLLGVQSYTTTSPTSTVVFQDSEGKGWTMNVSELKQEEVELLASGQKVKVLGDCLDEDGGNFYACGVFPLMMDKNMPMKDMSAERKSFVNRVSEYKEGVDIAKSGHCENMGTVKKMP